MKTYNFHLVDICLVHRYFSFCNRNVFDLRKKFIYIFHYVNIQCDRMKDVKGNLNRVTDFVFLKDLPDYIQRLFNNILFHIHLKKENIIFYKKSFHCQGCNSILTVSRIRRTYLKGKVPVCVVSTIIKNKQIAIKQKLLAHYGQE